jgi:DNA-directed RNA polymerase specialized sigma24 family protein
MYTAFHCSDGSALSHDGIRALSPLITPAASVADRKPNQDQSRPTGAAAPQLSMIIMRDKEEAVMELPQSYRTVIMLRDIEELSTAEAAEAFDLTEENLKVRLHRGHGMIRNWLFERIGTKTKEVFPFMANAAIASCMASSTAL